MPDYGAPFREIGESIRDALVAGPEAKLRVKEFNRKRQNEDALLSEKIAEGTSKRTKEAADLAEKKSKRADEDKLAESLRAKYGDEIGDLAKVNPAAAASIIREQIKATSRAKGPGRYKETFDGANALISGIQTQLNGAQQNVIKAMQGGNQDEISQARQTYNDMYSALGEKMKGYISNLDKDLKGSYAIQLSQQGDKMLQNLSPDKLDILKSTVDGVVKEYTGLSSDVLGQLDNANNEYGLGVDMSGVPSAADIQRYAWAGVSKGESSRARMKLILNERDPKELAKLANSEDAPDYEKKLAGSLVKMYSSYDAMEPKLRQKFSSMTDQDLQTISSKKSGIAATDAKDVLKQRMTKGASITAEPSDKLRSLTSQPTPTPAPTTAPVSTLPGQTASVDGPFTSDKFDDETQ